MNIMEEILQKQQNHNNQTISHCACKQKLKAKAIGVELPRAGKPPESKGGTKPVTAKKLKTYGPAQGFQNQKNPQPVIKSNAVRPNSGNIIEQILHSRKRR